jgi:hypothetical protein
VRAVLGKLVLVVLASTCVSACARPDRAAVGGGVEEPVDAAPATPDLGQHAGVPEGGCMANGKLDSGEPDDTCTGQPVTVDEGGEAALSTNRILPSGDSDTFAVSFVEGSHACGPGSIPHYFATVTLAPPPGVALTLGDNTSTCDDTWTRTGSTACVEWDGSCGGNPTRTFYFQVAGAAGASSCLPYTLTIRYCPLGDRCGC